MKHAFDVSSRTLTLSFPGDVLSTNADNLRQEVSQVLELQSGQISNWELLRLDLSAAKMVDSVGLNLLVSLIKIAKGRNGRVITRITSTNVQRAFLFTRLNTQMEVEVAA